MKGVDLKVYGTAPNGALLVSADEVNSGVQAIIGENAKLQQRNIELSAQIEQLRKMAYEKQAVMLIKYGLDGSACKRIYALLQDLVPAQYLAEHDREVAARAYAAALITYTDEPKEWCHLQAAEYANKIKSGKVEI